VSDTRVTLRSDVSSGGFRADEISKICLSREISRRVDATARRNQTAVITESGLHPKQVATLFPWGRFDGTHYYR
jgi:hypothetical protein